MQLIVDGIVVCQIEPWQYLPFTDPRQLVAVCADLIFAGGFE